MTAVLWEHGTSGMEVRGATEMIAYFHDRPDLERDLAAGLASVEARLFGVEVDDVDWVARYRESFRAFRAGSFDVVPAWDPAAEPGPRTLVVEPGLAFGTGTHETTRLCLGLLEERAARGRLGAVADIGTGSAILAIAAARLGGTPVVGVEIDAEALPWAQRHLALNAVPVHLVRGDGARALRPGSLDVVLANLTAPLLVERAPELLALRRASGVLLLSGLLVSDLGPLTAAYLPGSRLTVRTEGEWAALVCESP